MLLFWWWVVDGGHSRFTETWPSNGTFLICRLWSRNLEGARQQYRPNNHFPHPKAILDISILSSIHYRFLAESYFHSLSTSSNVLEVWEQRYLSKSKYDSFNSTSIRFIFSERDLVGSTKLFSSRSHPRLHPFLVSLNPDWKSRELRSKIIRQLINSSTLFKDVVSNIFSGLLDHLILIPLPSLYPKLSPARAS